MAKTHDKPHAMLVLLMSLLQNLPPREVVNQREYDFGAKD